MHSALVHPTPVEDYLHTELQASQIIGPIPDNALIQISRFGVIPKSGQPGKWCSILHLSSPHGSSVNDAIQKDMCSLTYTTVDQAIRRILHLGQGTLLVKINIQHAFEASQFTQRTESSLECHGMDACMWTQSSHSAYNQRRNIQRNC